jgi:hypothetical protein
LRHAKVAHEVSGLCHDEIVAMAQRLAQRDKASLFRFVANRVEGGDLFFKVPLTGHGGSLTDELGLGIRLGF